MTSNSPSPATTPLATTVISTPVRVSTSTVETAVNALLKYKSAKSDGEKLQLLPQDDYMYLNLTLKKIPSNPRMNPFKIPLSHPILDPSSQICLIIDDRPKSLTPPSEQIKKLVKSQNIPISKVLKISKLKSNYKPFEAKRKLCDSYELFLVDNRVVHLLPKLIGKEFFKRKKLPLTVDLGKSNLKSQVERALGSALLYLRTGTCSVMKVGKASMEKEQIVANVIDTINGAVEKVPKKWAMIRSLHLKFHGSPALPLYQAIPDMKLKIEGLKVDENIDDLGDIIENVGSVNKISGKGDDKSSKRKKKSKGRIHEVCYMDVGEDIDEDDGDNIDGTELVKSEDDHLIVGLKEAEIESVDESDGDDGNANDSKKMNDVDSNIIVGKKRSKAKLLKEDAGRISKRVKRVKKNTQLASNVGGKPKTDLGKVKESKDKKRTLAK